MADRQGSICRSDLARSLALLSILFFNRKFVTERRQERREEWRERGVEMDRCNRLVIRGRLTPRAGDRSVKTNPTSTMVDFQQMVNSPKTDWPNFDSTISQLIRKPINQCHG